MTEFDQEDVKTKNDESLRMLARSLTLSQGQFSLILARCNYRSLRQRLMQQLRERCPIDFRERVLDPSAKTLETTIQEELGDEPPPAVIICGLESVRDLDAVLLATNQARDEFRKNFPFPLVLWGTDEVLRRFIRVAPDFESWAATPIEFEIATDELIDFIQETADEVFAKVLDVGAGIFLADVALHLERGSPLRTELDLARKELQNRGVKLEPELEASLEFVLGRAIDDSPEQSRQHYERSLELWQRCPNLERQGCVLHSLGLWWRTYATRHRAEYEQARGREKDYFQQCVEAFEQANRKDLVAKFINPLGAILQELQQWDELEVVAKKALSLHQTYPDPFRLARAYGFLAELALAKSAWTEAKQLAEQALSILASAELTASTSVSSEQSANLDWVRSYHQGWHQSWYLFSLARSLRHASLTLSSLDQREEAIATLETALAATKPYYDPELYIRILEELRSLYFERGDYLKAFEIKQERRSIEQQYDFRAFVGAGRLQPKQQVINPVLVPVEPQKTLTQEITASGRQQDVNGLVERISRDDHKLIVIEGQSGVGKSSILQAGLIPALKQKAIGIRDVVPVLQQVYTDWIRELGKRLAEALIERQILPIESETFDSVPILLDQLKKHVEQNLLIVLIFDQFEEFFFVCKDPLQRRRFYEFMRECLDIPFVKVILSLREDYLYYLLECNDRLVKLDVINNNILDNKILYYLGNFSKEDAKLVIQSLTEQTQFSLEPSLVDVLVQDLARELGQVRPIELQVVGAQLQTEKITKLEQYQEQGPKEKLVGRFLEEVVKDCGPENEKIAKLVLYLLTNENNTRPFKTRADLERELGVNPGKLDLVLEIFVNSRLVLKVPALPVECFQLVHDYLVSFIRQEQSARLIAELEEEKEQRKLAEAKLNQVLKRQLKAAIAAGILLAILAGSAVGFALRAEYQRKRAESIQEGEINAIRAFSETLFDSGKDFEALIESVRAGRQLQRAVGATKDDTRMRLETALLQALYRVRERNRLQDSKSWSRVYGVSFSPNGKTIASAVEDKTVKLWSINGRLLKILKGHGDAVNGVSFSPDGKTIASASSDQTVRLWSIDGTLLKILTGHSDAVNGISFSPDGKTIASASSDKTVRLWSIDGTLLKTLTGHSNAVKGISFSPDGKTIASASSDQTVRLWSIDGTLLKTLTGHSGAVNGVSFSPDSKIIASASADGTVKLWRVDGKDKELTLIGYSFGVRNVVRNVSFSPDGKTIASASEDYTMKLWSVDGTLLKSLVYSNAVYAVSFSPDGQTIASAGADKTVTLRQLDNPLLTTLRGHRSYYVRSVSFSPDRKTLASASDDGTVKLWSVDGKKLTTLIGHEKVVWSVRFSPDGKTLASASGDKTVKLWRVSDGKELKALTGHNDEVYSVSFSPDGKTLASAGNDNTVKLWSVDGTLLKTLDMPSGEIWGLSFSPDGKIIASASSNKTVRLWSVNDGKELKTLTGHSSPVWRVSFSPDGKTIASASEDNTVKLWSVNDGKELKTLRGHRDWIRGVSFSPDGKMIASGSGDNSVKLWSVDGTLLKSLQGHSNWVWDVSFSPDGKTIASASADGTVILWNWQELHLDKLLVRGCDWVRDYLKTNPNVEESDRTLCDDILPQK
jgi:WD40 repeat protein